MCLSRFVAASLSLLLCAQTAEAQWWCSPSVSWCKHSEIESRSFHARNGFPVWNSAGTTALGVELHYLRIAEIPPFQDKFSKKNFSYRLFNQDPTKKDSAKSFLMERREVGRPTQIHDFDEYAVADVWRDQIEKSDLVQHFKGGNGLTRVIYEFPKYESSRDYRMLDFKKWAPSVNGERIVYYACATMEYVPCPGMPADSGCLMPMQVTGPCDCEIFIQDASSPDVDPVFVHKITVQLNNAPRKRVEASIRADVGDSSDAGYLYLSDWKSTAWRIDIATGEVSAAPVDMDCKFTTYTKSAPIRPSDEMHVDVEDNSLVAAPAQKSGLPMFNCESTVGTEHVSMRSEESDNNADDEVSVGIGEGVVVGIACASFIAGVGGAAVLMSKMNRGRTPDAAHQNVVHVVEL